MVSLLIDTFSGQWKFRVRAVVTEVGDEKGEHERKYGCMTDGGRGTEGMSG